ncbi:prephenate dehydratase [Rapidithrix thailandica]|uniref:prephenate dehydratase n=1 Tax=Rapidithrix thailandica TaxID=413964 RepID=A0AAW9S9J3_9BACT
MNSKKRIAIQGYEGSFHQIAARAYFQQPIETLPCPTFPELAALSGDPQRSEGGIMAIENSIAGSILPNYSLLQDSELTITGEVYLRIRQNLMALPGQSIEALKEVYSHPMAILQCQQFFKQYPHIKLIESEDTALSAQRVREQSLKGVGAIASSLAAELFELEILEESIETVKNNYTRFLILSHPPVREVAPEHNKMSLYFKILHQPGTLAKALNALANVEVNISKLQSFPVPGSEWQYYFHTDIEFETLSQYQQVLETLKPLTEELKVFGTYQKGKTIRD